MKPFFVLIHTHNKIKESKGISQEEKDKSKIT